MLRRILPYLGIIVFIAAIYDGAIFYSRWSSSRTAESARAEKHLDQERKRLDAVGGGSLKVLDFYAAPGTIKRGDHAKICYGVNGAKRVQIDPPVEEMWPALTRCIQVSPRKDTEYKLTADDGAGHVATESLVVKVIR